MFARLLDFLFPLRGDEATVRLSTAEKLFSYVDPALVTRTSPATVALLPFTTHLVRATIHEAKYHGNQKSFALLSEVLTDYLRDADAFGITTYELVPIPLSDQRLRERGFNQVEEVLTRTGKELEINIARALTRTRETASQVSLPRAKRLENMKGAFVATTALSPDITYVLVDDVLTTGATMQEAINALANAGATTILPIALAH